MKEAEVTDYYKILCAEYPDWLDEYINTRELQTQKYISVSCGMIYTDLFSSKVFYSSLAHSIAVALIVWNFTHDKKQTLAALFHDIATPAFKHCIDMMNGDYLKQESTEGLTTEFIKRSDDVMKLLERDGIKLEEINDYHIYPIADNDTPQLSADRLEYSLSNGYLVYNALTLDDIAEIYNDIEIQKNEFGEIEMGFKTKAIARKFVKITNRMSVMYRDEARRYSMEFIAVTIRKLVQDGILSVEDLYDMKEFDVIKVVESSKYKDEFLAWRKAKKLNVSDTKPEGVYSVNVKVKVRYIDPLYKGERMSKVCKIAKAAIDKNLAYDMDKYLYLS